MQAPPSNYFSISGSKSLDNLCSWPVNYDQDIAYAIKIIRAQTCYNLGSLSILEGSGVGPKTDSAVIFFSTKLVESVLSIVLVDPVSPASCWAVCAFG